MWDVGCISGSDNVSVTCAKGSRSLPFITSVSILLLLCIVFFCFVLSLFCPFPSDAPMPGKGPSSILVHFFLLVCSFFPVTPLVLLCESKCVFSFCFSLAFLNVRKDIDYFILVVG